MESDGQRSIVYRNAGCNNDIFSHRHNSSGLHGYNNRYTDSKSAADRGCYRHTCSHLSESEFNHFRQRRHKLHLESGRNRRKLYSKPNSHHNVQRYRQRCLGLYWYNHSHTYSESVANGGSHSNTCSHLCRPEFDHCSHRSKLLCLEPERLWHLVYSEPNIDNNLQRDRNIDGWLHRNSNSNADCKSASGCYCDCFSNCSLCRAEFNNSSGWSR